MDHAHGPRPLPTPRHAASLAARSLPRKTPMPSVRPTWSASQDLTLHPLNPDPCHTPKPQLLPVRAPSRPLFRATGSQRSQTRGACPQCASRRLRPIWLHRLQVAAITGDPAITLTSTRRPSRRSTTRGSRPRPQHNARSPRGARRGEVPERQAKFCCDACVYRRHAAEDRLGPETVEAPRLLAQNKPRSHTLKP